MTLSLVYAKKLRLPSPAANVAQALSMALAFTEELGRVRCFPGIPAPAGEDARHALAGILRDIGAKPGVPAGWEPLVASSKRGYGLRFRWALLKAALAEKGAVFYTRDLAEAAYITSLAGVIKRPLFYEAHEVLFRVHENTGKRDWPKTRQRERVVMAGAAGLIATSDVVADEAREYLNYAGPILVAPNGFSPDSFHAIPLFEQDAPWPAQPCPAGASLLPGSQPAADGGGAVRIVYLGNFHAGKGVEELIEAMALLPERFCLTIIGGHPPDALERLKNKAATTLREGRVIFTGALPQCAIRAACLGAHISVIPQQTEFFFSPLKLYESLALGLPVVMTPLSVFKEHIAAGLVYAAPDKTPAGLAHALAELAAEPQTARALREGGLEKARAHTWQERAKTVLEFMRGLS